MMIVCEDDLGIPFGPLRWFITTRSSGEAFLQLADLCSIRETPWVTSVVPRELTLLRGSWASSSLAFTMSSGSCGATR